MMRALYTAATGMLAQQTNVDNISNNLSNVNTVGFKQEKAEFKSLLYQTIQTKTTECKRRAETDSGTGGTRNESCGSHIRVHTGSAAGE